MSKGTEQLISTITKSFNQVGLDNCRLALNTDSNGLLKVSIEFSNAALSEGQLQGLVIDTGRFALENIDPALSGTEMMHNMIVRIEDLRFRMSAGIVNGFLESEKFLKDINSNSPVEIRGLRLTFTGNHLTIRGEVRKIISFPFAIDLYLEAVNNCLRIVFQNFWAGERLPLPSWVRRAIMSVAQSKIDNRPSLSSIMKITDDFLMVDPWSKVNLNVDGEFKKFGIVDDQFVIYMGRNPRFETEMANKVRKNQAEALRAAQLQAKAQEAAQAAEAKAAEERAAQAKILEARAAEARAAEIRAFEQRAAEVRADHESAKVAEPTIKITPAPAAEEALQISAAGSVTPETASKVPEMPKQPDDQVSPAALPLLPF